MGAYLFKIIGIISNFYMKLQDKLLFSLLYCFKIISFLDEVFLLYFLLIKLSFPFSYTSLLFWLLRFG